MEHTIEYKCNPALFPKPGDILCCNQFTVDECIEFPDYKPNIHKIIDVMISPQIDSYKLIDSPTGKKVFIKGHLDQEILYTVDSLCQPVHAFHSEAPFCTFIKLSDCNLYEYEKLEAYKPKILVEYMEATQFSCRSIRKCVLLFVWYPKGIVIPPKPMPPHSCCHRNQYNSGGKVYKGK
jgi:hypothetical protein